MYRHTTIQMCVCVYLVRLSVSSMVGSFGLLVDWLAAWRVRKLFGKLQGCGSYGGGGVRALSGKQAALTSIV